MVVKINPASPHVGTSLQYNEKKVAEGKASVAFFFNIDDPTNPIKTFEHYEHANIRTEKVSFHASINPGPNDNMSESQVIEFAKELMNRLGYGKQPYIIYRHDDIDRKHYHIVSVRVNKEGRKINDFKERKRCQEIMKDLSPKYGFHIGKGNGKEEIPSPYMGFDKRKGNYAAQIEFLADHAMRYHFTTVKQYDTIMRSLQVEVIPTQKRRKPYSVFYGLHKKSGRRCTPPIDSRKINVPRLETIDKHIRQCKDSVKVREKDRAANIIRVVLRYGTSELHFRRILAKQGILIDLSKNIDGTIFGSTIVDHQTKCCLRQVNYSGMQLRTLKMQDSTYGMNQGMYMKAHQKSSILKL